MDESRPFRIDTARLDHGHLVRVAGEVDLHSSPELREVFHALVSGAPPLLVVDLAEVKYMDSSGVGTLVELKRLIERRGGQVVLAALQPRVRSVFEIAQLDRFFRIAGSVDEAVRP
jgi:anti-sigma B factor antagonist